MRAAICEICHFPLAGFGWMRLDRTDTSDPDFAKVVPCPHNESVQDEYLMRINGLHGPEHGWRIEDYWEETGRDGVKPAVLNMIQGWRGWLVLHGGFGTGKTWIMKMLVNEATSARKVAFYQSLPQLLDHFRVAFKPENGLGFSELFDRVIKVPVLALDEIDKANPTPWAMEKLQQVIDHRYTHAGELATLLAFNDPAKVPGYILSRCRQFVVVEMKGADLRPIVKDAPF